MSKESKQSVAVVRCKSALRKQRAAVLYVVIAVLLLAVGLGVATYFTSRTAFYDPKDETKYYVVRKDGAYTLRDTEGVVLRTTDDGHFVTSAGTIVKIDKKTGDPIVIAAVMTEDSETVEFSSSKNEYDVLLYPMAERKDISSIEVHNDNGTFKIIKVIVGGEQRFVIDGRPDLFVGDSILFATLINCTGYTSTLMRLDTAKVKELGYAEYGLPENTDEATKYFVLTTENGAVHKVVIGDEVPSGSGYYVRYAGRDAVYVLKELIETEYNSTFSKTLFARMEDYVLPASPAFSMNNQNYFDVMDFKIFTSANRGTPVISFAYSGSVDKRNNTYYASLPYVALENLKGYYVNSFKAESCLTQMMEWRPERTVSVGNIGQTPEEYQNWLKQYGVDANSFQYRLSFTLVNGRTYDAATRQDVVLKSNQEQHEVLISAKQEDGLHYMYDICRIWDAEKNEFVAKPGYHMIVAISPTQLGFFLWEPSDWVDAEVFTGNIAYIEEIEVNVAPGDSVFPGGYHELFRLDNSESWNKIAADGKGGNISSDGLRVYDSAGTRLDTLQFKYFYGSLLYSSLAGPSSLSETAKDNLAATGESGAAFTIRIKYVLREFDKESKKYELTGEVLDRVYCFYKSYEAPREIYMTLNGTGDFFMVKSRVEKIIRDIGRLYTPEDVIDSRGTY